MPVRVDPGAGFTSALAQTSRPLAGMWACSGSPLVAEICAGSGLDWLLIDAEHSPNGLESLLAQLQAVHGYPILPVVRPPVLDPVIVKQYLDLGVTTLLIPMVDTVESARLAVSSAHYPPRGIRGVGSALARASRWNRTEGYLQNAGDGISIIVQIESVEAVANLEEITLVDGVSAVFIGPSDLAASMGLLGQQDHPDVVAVVERCIATVKRLGKPAGVNAFAEPLARCYLAAGVDFILVGADVAMLARGSEQLAAIYITEDGPEDKRASY
ncbi:MAG: 2,4-dihydroxyhept-2-enedioate aldolase [Subtercola sp.]|nr:2,4-dihydroxyhept-2-enedioate aldolase [Subtercola sp.]